MCVGDKETCISSLLFLQLSLCLLRNLFTLGTCAQMHTCFFVEILVFLNFVDGLNKGGGGQPYMCEVTQRPVICTAADAPIHSGSTANLA